MKKGMSEFTDEQIRENRRRVLGDDGQTVEQRRAALAERTGVAVARAYSFIEIKSATDGEERIITGIATTPTADRGGDVVEPQGAEFKLPIPLLMGHDSAQPIGHVTHAKVTAAGIEITARMVRIDEPGTLKDRLDEAWQSIKSGLVRGLSIGFKPLEAAPIGGSHGYRYLRWLWLELSACVIPANGDCSIIGIKAADQAALSARARPTTAGTTAPAPTLITTPAEAAEYLRKSTKPATMAQLMAYTDSMLKAVREALVARDERIKELTTRVAGLEKAPLAYDGPHRAGKTYRPGTFVTCNGQVYHANRETNARPGDGGPDWTLAVRKGQDAR